MRAIWKGSLSFGLINIPVKLYSAAKDRALKFKLVDKKDKCPISYAKICKNDGREVPWQDIARAYEIEKGQFVILDDQDFKTANAKKTEIIDIESFTPQEAIEPRYYEKPYFLEPEKTALKAYALFKDVLLKSQMVAIGRYVLNKKEKIGAISVVENILVLNQLRFKSELTPPENLKIPPSPKYTQKEFSMAFDLIKEMQEPFKAEKFKDTYSQELLRVIKSRAKGKTPLQKGQEPVMKTTDLSNILEMLENSLKQHKQKKHERKP